MKSENNPEVTYEKNVDCKMSDIYIPVPNGFNLKFKPSIPGWLTWEHSDDILKISIKENFFQERKIIIICSCEGKGNINCIITQQTGIIKSPLYHTINEACNEEFIQSYIAGDYPTTWPTAIIINQGSIIDAISLEYGNKIFKLGGTGGGAKKIPLQPGEYITGFSGSCATSKWNNKNYPVYNSVTFHTNKGKYNIKGNQGPHKEVKFYEAKPGNGVFGLYGISDRYLATLGFYETTIHK